MTDYFEWQPSYSVGVELFDDSHKQLLHITNHFVSATMERRPMEEVTSLLLDLVRYTRFHFRDEEDLMKETGYAQFAEHRKQHDELTDRLLAYVGEYITGNLDLINMAEFMMDWLITHILEEDMQYAQHFARAGIR